MSAFDLSRIGPGFADPVQAAQQVFRVGLDALAHPGRVLDIAANAPAPAGVSAAANALLLALLDQDTTLHVSAMLDDVTAQHLRFHTGCRLTQDIAEADFVLLATDDTWPDFSLLKQGSEYSPEQSATIVREVSSFAVGLPLLLKGAGIATTQSLQCPELDAAFVTSWQAMRGRFPRGIDLFLTCGSALAGLPRSTHINIQAEAACM